MNAYPVRLAAGLVLIALCALAEESPKVKMAEPQSKPAMALKTRPCEVGLNDQLVQLPAQAVNGLPDSTDRVNQDLHEAFQREEITASRTFYEKSLTKNTVVDLFGILLAAQDMMDHRAVEDAIPGSRDPALLPQEKDSHPTVAVPILRSFW
ncbi:MAG TPA: hypothetical protein VNV14_04930 [Opitutaceae bacterium]|jgi:hypothetical protein|nr:hypothetical protein [Opitutaceae bacterium]